MFATDGLFLQDTLKSGVIFVELGFGIGGGRDEKRWRGHGSVCVLGRGGRGVRRDAVFTAPAFVGFIEAVDVEKGLGGG